MNSKKFDEHDFKFIDLLERDKNLDKTKVGILGIPYDGATRGRPGARFAPSEVRKRLYNYSTYCIDYEIDISKITVKDFGDLDVHLDKLDLVKSRIEEHLKEIRKRADIWILIGGDHSITQPSFKALSEDVSEEIGLIVFDAHHDLRELSGGYISSGTVIWDLIESMGNKLKSHNIAQIGIRGFINSKYYVEKAKKLGILVYTAMDVKRFGMRKIIQDVLNNFEDEVKSIYVSFDVDSVDYIFAPGVNSPSVGGLTPYDVFEAMYLLGKNNKVFALDITEHAPPYDVAGVTSDLASNAILYFLAGIVDR